MAVEVGDHVTKEGSEFTFVVMGERYVDPILGAADQEPRLFVGILHEQYAEAELHEGHWELIDPGELTVVEA